MIIKLSPELSESKLEAIDVDNYPRPVYATPVYVSMTELEKDHGLPALGVWNTVRKVWVEFDEVHAVPAHLRGFLEIRARES